MILVKKRSLFILTVLLCAIVVLGEMKFFAAVKNLDVHSDLQIKYELENFIFAAILLLLIVFFFFINFIRKSSNVLKKLDKMVELSEFGRHDISLHLDKMGGIGKRVKYMLLNLNVLNEMKTLKISTLSRAMNLLMERSSEELFMLDCQGEIVDCSVTFARDAEAEKKDLKGRYVKDIFTGQGFQDIYDEFEKKHSKSIEKELMLKTPSGEKERKVMFIPVTNSKDQIANLLVSVKY